MKKLLLPILGFCLFISTIGCKKDNKDSCKTAVEDSCKNYGDAITMNAIVHDGAPPAADGPGLYIELEDSTEVHPTNLPEEYQQPGIHQKVKISFTYTGELFYGGMVVGTPGIKVISLKKIEKR